MEKRSVLQKVVLISVAAMAVAFAILTFVFHRLEGVKFEEGFLRVSAQADDPAATVYAGKIQGERVKITVTDCPDEQRTAVEVQVGDRVRDECVVETGLPPIQADQLGPVEHIRITRNGQLLFEGGYTAEHDMGWYDLEGNWDPFTMSVSYSSTAGDDYWEHYETDRGTILSFARGPQLVSRGSWMLYFTMLLFSGLLALDAAYPLALFRCQHMCDVKDPEPSDFYLGMQRAGWCIYPILLLIGYNIALICPNGHFTYRKTQKTLQRKTYYGTHKNQGVSGQPDLKTAGHGPHALRPPVGHGAARRHVADGGGPHRLPHFRLSGGGGLSAHP